MDKIKSPMIFLYPTYQCNDRCGFCFFRTKREENKGMIPFKDIKTVLENLRKNIKINSLVLAGGEPTIYKDFLLLLNYIYENYLKNDNNFIFHLATNAIKFSDENLLKEAGKYFISNKYPNNRINLSMSSLFRGDGISKLRKIGTDRVFKNLLNVNNILVITSDNCQRIKKIVDYIIHNYKRYYQGRKLKFQLEIRLPFLVSGGHNMLKFIPNADFFVQSIGYIIERASENQIQTRMYNIPLCYIKNEKALSLFRKEINPRFEMIGISPESYKDFNLLKKEEFISSVAKDKICKRCLYNKFCCGIDPDYIQKYGFPPLKNISYNDN